ncbi:MAG: hypothetical protein KAH62_02010 [Desulfobacula sp.]|nr:hypothetical protein [Desulfobacula sp.]
MPQTKFLLDTNAYLRLAYTIHPLLFVSFGDKNYTLYVIEDFQKEFSRERRLKRNFPWINQKEYRQNRSKCLTLSTQDKKNIVLAETFIWEQNISLGLSASGVDVRALSVGYILSIPIITDDQGMINLAESLGIEVMRILSLLSIMLKSNHIGMDKITELVGYLDYTDDLPYKNFVKDVNKEFGLNLL